MTSAMQAVSGPGQDPFSALTDFSERREEIEEARTFVTLELAGQWLAVDVTFVREILDRQVVTPLPHAQADVEGVIDVRGMAVMVMDISRKLGIQRCEETHETRFLVFEFDHGGPTATLLAVRADRVLEVSQIQDSEIEPPPENSSGWNGDVVLGVARISERLVMLIDLETVFPSAPAGAPASTHGDDVFAFE